MLKKLPQENLEDESVAAVSTICRSRNWDFNVQTKDKSAIDAEIEVVHGFARTGLFLKTQLKAGRSYVSSETDEVLRVRVESRYLRHWHQSNVQIALLFYDPQTQNVYWKDIRDYLRVHPNLLTGIQDSRIVEFHKRIDLLNSESLPVLEQVALGEFHYGFINLEEDATELALSNRFANLPLPPIWIAPTAFEDRTEIAILLKQDYAFTIRNHLLYSLADIRKNHCELGGYCEKIKATPQPAHDISAPILSELLNLSRDISMQKRGLEKRRERFFCPVSFLETALTNKFQYISLQGKKEQRTLIYIQNVNGKLERKHHAVKLSFLHENRTSFLLIEPDWHFTFPRKVSAQERKARLISEKAGLYNKEYLYLLHFWKQYLSYNSDRISFLISSNPMFGSVEFSSQAGEYTLPFRMTNDYFGPKRPTLQNP